MHLPPQLQAMMKSNKSRLILSFVIASLVVILPVAGQKKAITPDLSKLVAGQGWKVHNRTVTALNEDGKKGVRFDEREGDGVAWLEGVKFSDGTIEFDVRGKDVLQRSFVGLAFHGVDAQTFDAIYLRPFNFRSTDPVRRIHAVQYISHPAFTWKKLRDEKPEQYEKGITPAPDPNAWNHVRIVVASPKVSVFINDGINGKSEPSLVVDKLSERREGWVGFWAGTTAGGDFANLRITPAK